MHVVLQVLKRQILQVYNSFVSPYLLFVPNKYQLQCGFNTDYTLSPPLSLSFSSLNPTNPSSPSPFIYSKLPNNKTTHIHKIHCTHINHTMYIQVHVFNTLYTHIYTCSSSSVCTHKHVVMTYYVRVHPYIVHIQYNYNTM